MRLEKWEYSMLVNTKNDPSYHISLAQCKRCGTIVRISGEVWDKMQSQNPLLELHKFECCENPYFQYIRTKWNLIV